MKSERKLVDLVAWALLTAPLLAGEPALAQHTLFVQDGKVGIGTDVPVRALHVLGTTDAQILVENTGDIGNQAMFILRNAGRTRFQFENSSTGKTWFFQSNPSDNFTISLLGSGGPEVTVHQNGDMDVRGDVTANGVILTSSRGAKTDFAPVDSRQVLARVVDLPVTQWRFKTEALAIRHMGPVAEDFQAAFGLGSDGERISMTDAIGVALAAIQGLHRRVEEKELGMAELTAQVARLEAERDRLSRELAELKALVESHLQ